MDSTRFPGLAQVLVGRYTVVIYDPPSIGRSTREDSTQDITVSGLDRSLRVVSLPCSVDGASSTRFWRTNRWPFMAAR
jgi:hypothetical protein